MEWDCCLCGTEVSLKAQAVHKEPLFLVNHDSICLLAVVYTHFFFFTFYCRF